MVWPSSALISWPSMRIESFLFGTGRSFSAHVGRFHIAAEAAAGLIMSLFAGQAGDDFSEGMHAGADGERRAGMAAAGTRFFGCSLLVLEFGEEAVPAVRFHQLAIDVTRGLLAEGHSIRNVGGAGDHVAAGVEMRTAGFEGVAVDVNRPAFLQSKARGAGEVEVNRFADGQNDGVAIDALDFVGENRLWAPRPVCF